MVSASHHSQLRYLWHDAVRRDSLPGYYDSDLLGAEIWIYSDNKHKDNIKRSFPWKNAVCPFQSISIDSLPFRFISRCCWCRRGLDTLNVVVIVMWRRQRVKTNKMILNTGVNVRRTTGRFLALAAGELQFSSFKLFLMFLIKSLSQFIANYEWERLTSVQTIVTPAYLGTILL